MGVGGFDLGPGVRQEGRVGGYKRAVGSQRKVRSVPHHLAGEELAKDHPNGGAILLSDTVAIPAFLHGQPIFLRYLAVGYEKPLHGTRADFRPTSNNAIIVAPKMIALLARLC